MTPSVPPRGRTDQAIDLPDLKLVTTLRRFQGLLTDRYQLRRSLEDVRGILSDSPTGASARRMALSVIDNALFAAEQEDRNQLASSSSPLEIDGGVKVNPRLLPMKDCHQCGRGTIRRDELDRPYCIGCEERDRGMPADQWRKTRG